MFGWYFSGINNELSKIDHDHILWEQNESFKKYLEDNKKYYEDDEEYEMRKETYVKNNKTINHQSGTALMRLNQFADWYDSEYHDLIRLK